MITFFVKEPDSRLKVKMDENICFDEIQSVNGWEIFVHRKLEENYLVIVTGSNASLLSWELGTRLTGRHLDYEMFPFSFQEFLVLFMK